MAGQAMVAVLDAIRDVHHYLYVPILVITLFFLISRPRKPDEYLNESAIRTYKNWKAGVELVRLKHAILKLSYETSLREIDGTDAVLESYYQDQLNELNGEMVIWDADVARIVGNMSQAEKNAGLTPPRDLEALRQVYPQFSKQNLLAMLVIDDGDGILRVVQAFAEEHAIPSE